jgi:HPt (histidine-containing phosphotransfer) domain-containing protein
MRGAALASNSGPPHHRPRGTPLAQRLGTMHTPGHPVLNEATLAEVRALGDEMLEEIVALFVDDVAARMAQLHDAFRAQSADAIRREAHGLKGGALGVGAARLAGICEIIEQSAAAGQVDRAAGLEAAIEPAFHEASAALHALCRGVPAP